MFQTDIEIKERLRCVEEDTGHHRVHPVDSMAYRDGSGNKGALKRWVHKIRTICFKPSQAPLLRAFRGPTSTR